MEDWQKDHIQKNLVELIKCTICSTRLTTRLLSKQILSDDDIDVLEAGYWTSFEKSKKLYDILQGRVDSYGILVDSLIETRQTGAVKILKEYNSVFRSFGSISYDKNHVLGTGSFGTKVFKGTFGGRDVAVKVVNSDVILPEVALREVEILTRVDDHPNILRYIHVQNNDNFIYIALELCHISLHDEVQMDMLKLDPFYILEKCTHGLQHLHGNKIIHRDLKPPNVLLTAKKQVKIADFGLSKVIPADMTSVSVNTSGGTADWMAPEVIMQNVEVNRTGQRIRMSTSADIFSLGCIFAYVLTKGSHPFGGHLIRLHNICNKDHQLEPLTIDSGWLELIKKMIAFEKMHRPTCAQILASDCFQSQQQRLAISSAIGSTVGSYTEPHLSTQHVHQYNTGRFEIQHNAYLIKSQQHKDKPIYMADAVKRSAAHVISPSIGGMVSNIPDATSTDELLHQDYSDFPTTNMRTGNGVWRNVSNNRGESALHFLASNGDLDAMKYFLSLGGDVNAKDSDQKTVGHRIFSAGKNVDEALILALRYKLDVNAVDKDGNSVLFLAASTNRPRWVLEEIVRLGGDWNYTNHRGESILHVCAEKGNVQALKYFASLGTNINTRDNDGRTVLHRVHSAKQNVDEIIDFLVDSKLDINEVDKTGCNLLLLSINSGSSKESLEKIVRLGGDWKSRNKRGETAMHLAASRGNFEVMKYLVSLETVVNAVTAVSTVDNDECNILHHAAKSAPHSFREIIKLGLQNSMNINAVNKDGDSVLLLAIVAGKSKGDLEVIVKLNGDWKKRNNKGQSVLHLCAKRGNERALEYFISLGANVNWTDKDDQTGSHAIITSGITDKVILKTVLEKTENMNAVDKGGNNVVLLAVSSDKPKEVLEEIVRLGGDWRLRNRRGESVLHLSAASGNHEALSYFLKLGADVNATDNDGCTAGHRLYNGKRANIRQCLKVLFEYNLNVHATDNSGYDLVLIAAKNRSTKEELKEIVQVGNYNAIPGKNEGGGN